MDYEGNEMTYGKTADCKRFWKRHWWKVLLVCIGIPIVIFIILILVAIIIASTVEPTVNPFQHIYDNQDIDYINDTFNQQRAQRLADALKIPTVSYSVGDQELDAFLVLHEHIRTSFPLIHSSPFITRYVVNTHSLLYAVAGSDADAAATLPYLLASHMDVVPADPETWDEAEPFGGEIKDGVIYGRGAIDDKSGVMAILEALEYMLETGQRPRRNLYLAFGHDEEITGEQGANELAKKLVELGVPQLDFLVDEGLGVTRGVLPGTDQPIGVISVTEKGYMVLELTVLGHAGHSSFPPDESTIGILSNGIAKLEDRKQPSQFGKGLEVKILEDMAPHCSYGYKLVYSNLWLFGGIVGNAFAAEPLTDALIRTTTAVTMFNAGVKENVVPPSAVALVNLRVHPEQTIDEVIEYVRDTIDDSRVLIEPVLAGLVEPLPVSPSGPEDVAYHLIEASLDQVLDDGIIVAGLFFAITDTRWYLSFTQNIYRLYPYEMTLVDAGTIHGDNERIDILNYHRAINFYYRLIKNADLLLDV